MEVAEPKAWNRPSRLLAAALGILLIPATPAFWVIGSILSQEGYYDENGEAVVNLVSATISQLATVSLLATIYVALRFAIKGRSGRLLVGLLAADAALLGAYALGLATWCSGCGVP